MVVVVCIHWIALESRIISRVSLIIIASSFGSPTFIITPKTGLGPPGEEPDPVCFARGKDYLGCALGGSGVPADTLVSTTTQWIVSEPITLTRAACTPGGNPVGGSGG